MKLLSVNVAMPKTFEYNGRPVLTGIFKTPAPGRVMMRRLNIEGDGQGDLSCHGGEHKAVYAYPFEHYAFWRDELERTNLAYGQFGENLTTEGLLEDAVCIGDVYRIGEALAQVTQPRVPCFKSALKMDRADFPKRFLESERSGFYLRVLEEGCIGAGDVISLVSRNANSMTVKQVHHLHFFDKTNVAEIRRALSIPELSPEWRREFEEILSKSIH